MKLSYNIKKLLAQITTVASSAYRALQGHLLWTGNYFIIIVGRLEHYYMILGHRKENKGATHSSLVRLDYCGISPSLACPPVARP